VNDKVINNLEIMSVRLALLTPNVNPHSVELVHLPTSCPHPQQVASDSHFFAKLYKPLASQTYGEP
jgi:hypothetical protein